MSEGTLLNLYAKKSYSRIPDSVRIEGHLWSLLVTSVTVSAGRPLWTVALPCFHNLLYSGMDVIIVVKVRCRDTEITGGDRNSGFTVMTY